MAKQRTTAIPCPTQFAPEKQNSRGLLLVGILYGFAFVIVLLHVYAGFHPSALNWGFHFLGFFDIPFRITWTIIALSFLIPCFTRRLLAALQTLIARASRINKYLLVALVSVGVYALLWLLREQVYILGDGYLNSEFLTRPTIKGKLVAEPLTAFIFWFFYQKILLPLRIEDPALSFVILNCLAGVAFLFVLRRLAGLLFKTPIEKLVMILFVLSAGSSQLFFGYVEDYALLLLVLLVYILVSVRHLHGKGHWFTPAVMLGVLFTLHFGAIFLAPTLLISYLREKSIWKIFLQIATAIAVAAIIFVVIGYPFHIFVDTFLQRRSLSGSHALPMAELSSEWQRYTIFSWEHLLDMFNQQMLVTPFALLMIVSGMLLLARQIQLKDPVLLFLIASSLCTFLFLGIVNCEIGASRDWDLQASYSLPHLLLAGFLWIRYGQRRIRLITVLIVYTVVTLLHTISFVLINADEQKGAHRFEVLIDSRLWARNSIVLGVGDLLKRYYVAKGDYQTAALLGEKFSREFPNDAYIQKLAGDIYYENLHQEQKAETFYSKAVELSHELTSGYYRDACVRLGNIYNKKGQVDDAISAYQKAVAANPQVWDAYFNLGNVYFRRREYGLAAENFEKVIQLEPSSAESYKYCGISYYYLGNFERARFYWSKFLELRPDDVDAEMIRQLLQEKGQ